MDPMTIIRDPAMARNRIFIGNIPEDCTRPDIEEFFGRYGTIIGVLIQKNFAFVQYENEQVANKAAAATSMTLFKGKKITVRNAGSKKNPKQNSKQGGNDSNEPQMQRQQQHSAGAPPQHSRNLNPDYNDCEIIVVAKGLTEYAEYIEQWLKRLGLQVDLLFPNEDVPIGKVLANISLRGCLYAILVTPQNEEHRSITVNILYGQPAEHRNMPIEDAVMLISTDFQKKMKEDSEKQSQPLKPKAASIAPASNSLAAPPLKEVHPEAIQTLLNSLSDNRPLTVLQYDKVIKYLGERRQLQVVAELGESAEDVPPPVIPSLNLNVAPVKIDPEVELQKKIYEILNKPSITGNKNDLLYTNVQSLQKDSTAVELLQDIRVQKALDSLMKSNLVASVENFYDF